MRILLCSLSCEFILVLAGGLSKRYILEYLVNFVHIMADLRRLPNLAALRAFEAAARHENFSRAAEEIHVTHGAISHQVRALEEELGVSLFVRHGKRIAITQEGERFAAAIRKALTEVAAAADFFLSAANSYVTGAVLAVDGGLGATF